MKEIILHNVTKENDKRFVDFIISTKEDCEYYHYFKITLENIRDCDVFFDINSENLTSFFKNSFVFGNVFKFYLYTKEEKEKFDRKIYEMWNGEIIDDNDERYFKNFIHDREN